MIADRITVSTVAMGPHGASDVSRMQRVALRAGGRFYEVTDASKLPQIFIKEASTIQRSMIIEGDIPPVVLGTTEALKGIPKDAIPTLHGYTITHPKPLSKTSMGALVPKDQSGGTGLRPVSAVYSETTSFGAPKKTNRSSSSSPL